MSPFVLAMIVAFVGFGAFITVGAGVQLVSIPFGLWWSEAFVFFGLPFAFVRLSGRDAFASTGLRRPWVAGAAFGFFLGFANFFAAAIPLNALGQMLVPHAWLEMFDSSVIFKDKSTFELGVIIAAVSVAAPFCEEYFFRGVLQTGVATVMKPRTAVVVVAVWFSFCHLDPVGFLARVELGVLFGLLAWRTGSLWPGIFAHLGNNLTSSVLFLATRGKADDISVDEGSQLLVVAGVGGVLLTIAYLIAWKVPKVFVAPEPRVDALKRSQSAIKILGPWALAGVLSFGVFLAANPRGAAISLADSLTPVKEPQKDATDKERSDYAEARALREKAISGELPVKEYFQQRIGKSKAWDKSKLPAPPPPKPANPPAGPTTPE